jgi:hypothetical protein
MIAIERRASNNAMRVFQDFVEYVETKSTPRLTAE